MEDAKAACYEQSEAQGTIARLKTYGKLGRGSGGQAVTSVRGQYEPGKGVRGAVLGMGRVRGSAPAADTHQPRQRRGQRPRLAAAVVTGNLRVHLGGYMVRRCTSNDDPRRPALA